MENSSEKFATKESKGIQAGGIEIEGFFFSF